ncbi:hypothetical protein SAMN05216227_100345 [Pseudorhodobacter antarcticus]|jgi:hypothetical protein|uniref:Uncharacterized protein n=1 Tax=Pseudorhodobacter antarcticus TaxID=1077947 RepID=A0A1H8BLA6_9RHOB|nr:hypothetical protein SAMN05216227_100345 [Pseudorhodobacter antarcticus]
MPPIPAPRYTLWLPGLIATALSLLFLTALWLF